MGWLNIVELNFSDVISLSIAIKPWCIISDAEGPKTWMPNIWSVSLSAWMVTDPVESPDAKALPIAAKGKDPGW